MVFGWGISRPHVGYMSFRRHSRRTKAHAKTQAQACSQACDLAHFQEGRDCEELKFTARPTRLHGNKCRPMRDVRGQKCLCAFMLPSGVNLRRGRTIPMLSLSWRSMMPLSLTRNRAERLNPARLEPIASWCHRRKGTQTFAFCNRDTLP